MEAAQQVEAPNAELTDEETGMIEFYKFWASLSPFMAETVCRRILPFLRPIHAADYAARFACGKAWDTSDRDEMFTGILNLAHPQGPDADFGLKENGKWTEDNVKELFRTTWIGGVPNTLEIEERDTVYKSTISIPRVNPPRANMEPLDFGNALVTLNDLGMLKD